MIIPESMYKCEFCGAECGHRTCIITTFLCDKCVQDYYAARICLQTGKRLDKKGDD